MNTNQMDPDIAKTLFENAAFLIIAGVPIGTEFGIDLASFNVGENFRGIKMIPPGAHYIYCASRGPYGDTSFRVGFIHYFKQKEIIVREWDAEKEELRIRSTEYADVEKQQIRDNLKSLDRYLGVYDYSTLQHWKKISDYITEDIILKLSPDCGIVRPTIELLSCPDSERPRGKDNLISNKLRYLKINAISEEDAFLPNLKPVPGTVPNFTELPERCPRNSTPAEITLHHLDSIQSVDKLMQKFNGNISNLIGEMQFAFVLFRSGCSVESLAHWRKFISILCNSDTAVLKYKHLYVLLLNIFLSQLPEMPEELLEQSIHNTVLQDIKKLIINCTSAGLNHEVNNFKNNVSKSLLWNFDNIFDENLEDLPIIVEM